MKDDAEKTMGLKLKIFFVVTTYMFISISLVFLNKFLVTKSESIDAPLFVTWYQCVVSVVIIYCFGKMKSFSDHDFFKQFPDFEYNLGIAAQIARLTAVFIAMVSFNNLCLQLVEVSFYNVARSLTVVFNVFFTYTILSQTTSFKTMGTLIVVLLGFGMGAYGEPDLNFSLKGTIFGVISSMFVSLNSIYTNKLNDVVKRDNWLLALYNNLNACFMFLPLIYLFEWHIIVQSQVFLHSPVYWLKMTIAGVLGCSMSIITAIQINLTSALTHNVAATAKSCIQTVFAFLIWKNPTTGTHIVGNVMTLLGTGVYTYVRNQEMDAAKKQQQSLPTTTQSVELAKK